MSHQFKPGDLALVISASAGCEQNIGMVVEVVEVECPAVDPYPICVRGEGMMGRFAGSGQAFPVTSNWCRPAQLMPLRGDFELGQQKSKEAEPCA
ncbi:hypothetical protein ACF8GG_19735 [Pseudomonas sp. yb_1]|uniref:hypothetical protein n=1 Tax=Pseudomonas TaxID=286 RepID=UPI002ED507BB|nr:hypothetical protein V1687_16995 [Pseudomonas putida]